MALKTTIGSQTIPEGAIRVTKDEALSYQRRFVNDWPKESDVLFLRYGKLMASGIVGVSSYFCWSFFRDYLSLRNKSFMVTAIPAIMIPTCSTSVFFNELVTDKVLLMKPDCPLCQLLPYGVFQLLQGLVYPCAVSLLTGMHTAVAAKSCNMPELKNNSKEVLKFIRTMIGAGRLRFQIIGALQLLTAVCLPYMQDLELNNLIKLYREKNYTEDFKENELFE